MSASSCIGRWSCWGGRHARNVLLLGFGAKDFAVTTEVESGVGRCLSVGTAESERIYIINLFPLFFAIDFRPRRSISVLDLVIFLLMYPLTVEHLRDWLVSNYAAFSWRSLTSHEHPKWDLRAKYTAPFQESTSISR